PRAVPTSACGASRPRARRKNCRAASGVKVNGGGNDTRGLSAPKRKKQGRVAPSDAAAGAGKNYSENPKPQSSKSQIQTGLILWCLGFWDLKFAAATAAVTRLRLRVGPWCGWVQTSPTAQRPARIPGTPRPAEHGDCRARARCG